MYSRLAQRAKELAVWRRTLPFMLSTELKTQVRHKRRDLLQDVYSAGLPSWKSFTEPMHKELDEKAISFSIKYKSELDQFLEHSSKRQVSDMEAFIFTHRSLKLEGITFNFGDSLEIWRRVHQTRTMLSDDEVLNHSCHATAIAMSNIFLADEENSVHNLNLNFILKLHKYLMLSAPQSLPGQIRRNPIQISGFPTIFPYSAEVPNLLKLYFAQLNEGVPKDMHPVIFSVVSSVKFAHIHPFQDGNGRASRLLMAILCKDLRIKDPIKLIDMDRDAYSFGVCMAQHGEPDELFDLTLEALNLDVCTAQHGDTQ